VLQGPNTDPDVLKNLRQSLEKDGVFHGCTINYRKDGSEFYNEWHIEPIYNHEGELTNYMAVQRDVTERIEAQKAIESKNMALREILEQIEMEKKKIKDNILINVEEILLPAFQKLKRKGTRLDQKYLEVIEANLQDITSSFGTVASHKHSKLSPREVEIANLIKSGLSSKEICQMINISFKTVETHRNKIRKKLGIINKDINLTSYLQSI
jgi:DNA-binding CsgD family transcriptional regulator